MIEVINNETKLAEFFTEPEIEAYSACAEISKEVFSYFGLDADAALHINEHKKVDLFFVVFNAYQESFFHSLRLEEFCLKVRLLAGIKQFAVNMGINDIILACQAYLKIDDPKYKAIDKDMVFMGMMLGNAMANKEGNSTQH